MGLTRLLRALYSWVLKTSKNRDCVTSLGNPLHCRAVLMVKMIFLIANLNFCFRLVLAVPHAPTMYCCEEPRAVSSILPIGTGGCCLVPCSCLLPRLSNPSSLSLFLQDKCSSPNYLGGLHWTCSSLSLPSCIGLPKTLVFWMRSNEYCV